MQQISHISRNTVTKSGSSIKKINLKCLHLKIVDSVYELEQWIMLPAVYTCISKSNIQDLYNKLFSKESQQKVYLKFYWPQETRRAVLCSIKKMKSMSAIVTGVTSLVILTCLGCLLLPSNKSSNIDRLSNIFKT